MPAGDSRDPELTKLLVQELDKHAPSLAEGADLDVARRALHALKGSASLAGFRELGAAFARLERRVAAGERAAAIAALALVVDTAAALRAGEALPLAPWPTPPPDLVSRPVAAEDARYAAEMRDRLERLDDVLARADDGGAIGAAYREVHAMKGAALAVSDEALAWFCHGLEELLRAGEAGNANAALAEVARHRLVLAELLVAPDRALDALAQATRASRPPGEPQPERAPTSQREPARRARVAPRGEPTDAAPKPEDTLRVATVRLERLFERMRQIGQARGQVTAGARVVQNLADRSRQVRQRLAEALRLIGPPRPWGAPAAAIALIEEGARALGGFAEQLDEEAAQLKETADRVRTESGAAHAELAEIRTTRAGWLFERVASATLGDARRLGRDLRFFFSGEETGIDRRVAEQLFDPLLQIARNAVAHGVESASERAIRGKPRVGAITLVAERRSGGLRIVVRDDGAGVNVGDVRARAVALGVISSDTAGAADDATLLALLFVPGFTTSDGADLLSGRGVGLDLTLEAVHRLGGTIRLASEAGMGLTATIDIPFEPGLVRVLWLETEDSSYALPIEQARLVVLGRDAPAARPLADLLDASRALRRAEAAHEPARAPALVVVVEPAVAGAAPALVGVDAIGAVEEVALRRLSPLVRTAGPYAGAILRGDSLRLCLDAAALAELATSAG